jgi:hypothetical protein
MTTYRSRRPGASLALREALRALKLEARKPTDADRPPPSTFPGRKVSVRPGQLDFEGREVLGLPLFDDPQ